MVDKYQKKLQRSPLFIGGDVVNTHANELKNCLLKIIDEMRFLLTSLIFQENRLFVVKVNLTFLR